MDTPVDDTQQEIMTLEEVAEYLRISVKTVYDWAQRGEIPCGKLGGSWRFKRSAIETWLEDRLGRQKSRLVAPAISIADVLKPDRVFLTDKSRKKEIFDLLIESLGKTKEVKEPAELAREIVRREELMSTGIGLGIGMPHVRLDSVKNIVMAAAVNDSPIDDYASLDGERIRIVCMVAARWNQHAAYLRVLAATTSRLRREHIRNAVLAATDAATAYQLLAEDDSNTPCQEPLL